MHRKCVWGGGRGGEREGVVSGFLRPGTFGPPHTVIPNVILTWHVHGKQNLNYDHYISWGKQANYKMLKKLQSSKTTKLHKRTSSETTVCLRCWGEISEVTIILKYRINQRS